MQELSGVRQHSTAEQRKKILRSYRESSLTQREFAQQAGISLSTLQSWLRKAAAAGPPPEPRFWAVPNLLSAPSPVAAYRLQWPGGFSLEVRSGFAAEELAGLLQLLPRL